ncbi:hypothetical protein [Streptomyces sp. NPDC018610]|uniref:hypothetical protein n=1 Tax=Streptomyces sp. NPDC018610 TaxID=3365049 RepID=UPI0037AE80A4
MRNWRSLLLATALAVSTATPAAAAQTGAPAPAAPAAPAATAATGVAHWFALVAAAARLRALLARPKVRRRRELTTE